MDHSPPFRAPGRAASRTARTGIGNRLRAREPMRARAVASHVPRASRDARGTAALGRRGAAVYGALAGELGYRRFRRLEEPGPLAGAPRGRIHRVESAARA